MEPDAPLTGVSWPRDRALPAFLLMTALIMGLFGMHILGMSLPSASMTAPNGDATVQMAGYTTDHGMAAVVDAAAIPDGMSVPGGPASTAPDDAACGSECGDPMPHHPALMMCCELALSGGGTTVANPGPLALPVEPVTVAGHVGSVLAALVERIPPPPSLIVLSISRT